MTSSPVQISTPDQLSHPDARSEPQASHKKGGSVPLMQAECSSPSCWSEVTDERWSCLSESVDDLFLSGFVSIDIH
jgi:hypothetical protein